MAMQTAEKRRIPNDQTSVNVLRGQEFAFLERARAYETEFARRTDTPPLVGHTTGTYASGQTPGNPDGWAVLGSLTREAIGHSGTVVHGPDFPLLSIYRSTEALSAFAVVKRDNQLGTFLQGELTNPTSLEFEKTMREWRMVWQRGPKPAAMALLPLELFDSEFQNEGNVMLFDLTTKGGVWATFSDALRSSANEIAAKVDSIVSTSTELAAQLADSRSVAPAVSNEPLDHSRELEWLEGHLDEVYRYQRKWLAISPNGILASAETMVAALSAAKDQGVVSPLLFQVPSLKEWPGEIQA